MIGPSRRALFSVCVFCTLGLGLTEWGSREAPAPANLSGTRLQIVESLQGSRPFEARFLGGFVAGPLEELSAEVQERLRELTESAARGDLEDRALLEALDGNLDHAVALFEVAALRKPGHAPSQADLAASYLARGESSPRPFDDFRALAAAQKALRLDPSLVEARYARALALERLRLPSQEAWDHCLEIEPSRDWRAEIQERLRRADRRRAERTTDPTALLRAALEGDRAEVAPLVAARPRTALETVAEELLPLWAAAHTEGSPAVAASTLAAARRIADALAETTGDSFLRDSLRAIDQAVPEDGDRLRALLRGHAAQGRGRELFKQGAYAAAAQELEIGRSALAAADSPFELRARLYLGYSERYVSGHPRALASLSELAESAQTLNYPLLAGEGFRLLGLLRLDAGEPHLAQEAYQKALRELERAGDPESLARTHSLLAEFLSYQGEAEEAWTQWGKAARIASTLDDPQILYQVYSVAAMTAFRSEEPEAAAAFQEQVVDSARRSGNPVSLTWALIWRARYLQRIAEEAPGRQALREAERALDTIPDQGARVEAAIGLEMADAELSLQSAPERAVESLDRLLEQARNTNSLFLQIDAHLLRARAQAARGHVEAAEGDLRQGIDIATRWRRRTLESAQKIRFQDRQRQLFDQMVALQLDHQRDPVRALASLEEQRSQILLDRLRDLRSGGAAEPEPGVRPVKDLAPLLPSRTIVISYALLGSRVGIWVSGAGGTRFRSVDVVPGRLREMLRNAARRGPSSGTSELLPELLYEMLLSPVRDLIPRDAYLVICAGGDLDEVSWAALRDRRTGRFLVEDHAILTAPSIGVYLESLERDRKRAPLRTGRLLAVGNPAFARRQFPTLKPLPAAEAEARRAGDLSPGSLVLTGAEATRGRLLREMAYFDILHFGAHVEANRQTPGLSRLVLAAEPGAETGEDLSADDVSRLHLERVRLVILATCGSAEGSPSRSEGTQSLARAFLASGAPAVVATLWRVSDADSAELISEFHHRLRAGDNAADALRSAQLSALRKADPPRGPRSTWAAFQLVGGVDTDHP